MLWKVALSFPLCSYTNSAVFIVLLQTFILIEREVILVV
jgi:hypothetical protein